MFLVLFCFVFVDSNEMTFPLDVGKSLRMDFSPDAGFCVVHKHSYGELSLMSCSDSSGELKQNIEDCETFSL